MSLLQIDTINIVARSPYLVLFSRLGKYPAQWLDDALKNGDLMEYWAHEACFLPRSDFALFRHRMLAPDKMGWKYRQAWMQSMRRKLRRSSHIFSKMAPFVRLILNIRVKGPAAGGNGSRISAILKGCLPQGSDGYRASQFPARL
jgi:uncharacterized protein YcaQ